LHGLPQDYTSSQYAISNSNRDETELYLKPGAIIKERQICQTFQLNSAHDQLILHTQDCPHAAKAACSHVGLDPRP